MEVIKNKNNAGEIPLFFNFGGDDVPKLEPKGRLNFWTLDKSIRELRAMFKAHPEWFEIPKPKSVAGKNEPDYMVK